MEVKCARVNVACLCRWQLFPSVSVAVFCLCPSRRVLLLWIGLVSRACARGRGWYGKALRTQCRLPRGRTARQTARTRLPPFLTQIQVLIYMFQDLNYKNTDLNYIIQVCILSQGRCKGCFRPCQGSAARILWGTGLHVRGQRGHCVRPEKGCGGSLPQEWALFFNLGCIPPSPRGACRPCGGTCRAGRRRLRARGGCARRKRQPAAGTHAGWGGSRDGRWL